MGIILCLTAHLPFVLNRVDRNVMPDVALHSSREKCKCDFSGNDLGVGNKFIVKSKSQFLNQITF